MFELEGEGEGDGTGVDDLGADLDGDGADDLGGAAADGDGADAEGGAAPAAAPGGSAGGGDQAPADVLLTFTEREWAQELLADQDEKGQSYSLTEEELDGLPIEAKRALASLAHRSKALEAQLQSQHQRLQERQESAQAAEDRALRAAAEALSWTEAPKLKEFLASLEPKGKQPDPSSPEGIQWLADQRMAQQMKAFFESLKQDGAARKEASEAAQANAAREKRLGEITAYMEKFPEDFEEGSESFKAIHALHVKSGRALSVEECHKIVRAQRLESELERSNADELKAARARVAKGGTRGRPIPELPKNLKGTEEIDAWYEQHPEARDRDIERLVRQGAL